jgi:hypothetical protein
MLPPDFNVTDIKANNFESSALRMMAFHLTRHSAFIPASLITLPHLATSDLM